MKIEGVDVKDGRMFKTDHSRARWLVLKTFQDAGEIKELKCFSRWPLKLNGISLGNLEAEFEYLNTGTFQYVVEFLDIDGEKEREVIALKKKIFRALYPGVELRKVKM